MLKSPVDPAMHYSNFLLYDDNDDDYKHLIRKYLKLIKIKYSEN